jgi:MFS superfamily sulfate permease-like transporter
MLLGAEGGLFCGSALPFVAVAVASALPKTRVLGRLPGTEPHLSVKQYPGATPIPGCVVAGTDSPLYYLDAQPVED